MICQMISLKNNERSDDMKLPLTEKFSNTGKNISSNQQSIQKVKIKQNIGFKLGKNGCSGKIVHGKEVKY